LTFKDSIKKLPIIIDLDNYSTCLEVTKYIKLSCAYAVSIHNSKIIEILKRHGFKENRLPSNQDVNIERYYYLNAIGNDNPSSSYRQFLNDDDNASKDMEKKSYVKIKQKVKTQ
jgi:hypothetical protein